MEKNHKTAVMFLTYLKLILGTERVYSLKKKTSTEKARRKQTKSNKDKPSQTKTT